MYNDKNKASVVSTAVSLPGLVLPTQTECEEGEEEDGAEEEGGHEDRGQTDGQLQSGLGELEVLQHLVTVRETAANLQTDVRGRGGEGGLSLPA